MSGAAWRKTSRFMRGGRLYHCDATDDSPDGSWSARVWRDGCDLYLEGERLFHFVGRGDLDDLIDRLVKLRDFAQRTFADDPGSQWNKEER